jgi:hypothetical protein
MSNKLRISIIAACCFTAFGVASAQPAQAQIPDQIPIPKAQIPAQVPKAQIPAQVPKVQMPKAQIPAQLPQATEAQNPSPELIDNLTKELSITPAQAIGGSGALFGLAKSRLKPEEFAKVSDAVPGMDGLLKAAPKPASAGGLGAMSNAMSGQAGGLGAMSGVLPGKAGALGAIKEVLPGKTGGADAVSSVLPGKPGGLASVDDSFKSLGFSPDMAGKFVPIMTKFVEAKGGASVGNLLSGALK